MCYGHSTILFKMILAVTMLLFPLVGVYADYKSWCGTNSDTEIDLSKSEDGVPGRYIVQWCSHGDRNITQWKIELRYLRDNRSPENCVEYDVFNVHPHADLHSTVEETINLNFSCPILCLAKPLDLLFSSCYTLKSRVKFDNLSQHNDTMHYIHNNLTLAHYKNSTTYVHKISNDEQLVLVWHSGYIPITEYSVHLLLLNDSAPDQDRTTDVSAWCEAAAWDRVRCAGAAPPARYRATLQHLAPWAHAGLVPSSYRWSFNHSTSEALTAPAQESGGAGGAVLVAGGALAGCAAAALAALALSARRRRKRVLRDWQAHRLQLESSDKSLSPATTAGVGGGEVLLLYARDPPALQAARALQDLLHCAGAQVVDVHSAAAAARWAAAPAQSARAFLASGAVRVVLLLSPALRLAQEDEAPAPHGAPPQFGDVLLQYALRMMATSPPAAHPYKKFFVATLPGAECSAEGDAHTLAHLVPFARFPLPGAAPPLLQQLGLPRPPPALHAFSRQLAASGVGVSRS